MDIEEAIERLKYINMAYDYNNYYSRYDLDCIETALNLIQTQQAELEKKEKQIDLMAKEIYECNEYIDNEFERELKFKSVEDVKQYFTKKVEGK